MGSSSSRGSVKSNNARPSILEKDLRGRIGGVAFDALKEKYKANQRGMIGRGSGLELVDWLEAKLHVDGARASNVREWMAELHRGVDGYAEVPLGELVARLVGEEALTSSGQHGVAMSVGLSGWLLTKSELRKVAQSKRPPLQFDRFEDASPSLRIPKDVWSIIFRFLSYRDLARACYTCKKLANIALRVLSCVRPPRVLLVKTEARKDDLQLTLPLEAPHWLSNSAAILTWVVVTPRGTLQVCQAGSPQPSSWEGPWLNGDRLSEAVPLGGTDYVVIVAENREAVCFHQGTGLFSVLGKSFFQRNHGGTKFFSGPNMIFSPGDEYVVEFALVRAADAAQGQRTPLAEGDFLECRICPMTNTGDSSSVSHLVGMGTYLVAIPSKSAMVGRSSFVEYVDIYRPVERIWRRLRCSGFVPVAETFSSGFRYLAILPDLILQVVAVHSDSLYNVGDVSFLRIESGFAYWTRVHISRLCSARPPIFIRGPGKVQLEHAAPEIRKKELLHILVDQPVPDYISDDSITQCIQGSPAVCRDAISYRVE